MAIKECGFMDLSLFLAKILGIYLILGGMLIVYKRDSMEKIIREYFKSPALVMVGGAMSIIIGLLIVISHNVWKMDWRLAITLIGYLSLLKGIVHWFFSDYAASVYPRLAKSRCYLCSAAVFFLLGLYLTYVGYISVR